MIAGRWTAYELTKEGTPPVKMIRTTFAAAALLSVSSTAGATILLDQTNTNAAGLPGTATILSTNDAGYTGEVALGQLSVADAGRIRFEYLGNEAGYTNSLYLYLGGELVFLATTDGFQDPGAFSSWYEVAGGYLPFSLCTSGGLLDTSSTGSSVAYGKCVHNNIAGSISDQWFLSGEGYRSIGYREEQDGSWLIFWDDSGAGNDDDYDDLIARVHYEVPEPGTLALLGLGLMGLGASGRRRKA